MDRWLEIVLFGIFFYLMMRFGCGRYRILEFNPDMGAAKTLLQSLARTPATCR
jgi:hypothetical protein